MKKWCPTYTISTCNGYSVEADDKSFICMTDYEFEDIVTKSNEMLAISVFEVVRLLYDFTEYPEEVMIRLINSINNKAVIAYDWEKANYQEADTDRLVELVKKLKKRREKYLEEMTLCDVCSAEGYPYDAETCKDCEYNPNSEEKSE